LTYTLRVTGEVGPEPLIVRALMSESRVRGETHEAHYAVELDGGVGHLIAQQPQQEP
jgi:hypothetical protein